MRQFIIWCPEDEHLPDSWRYDHRRRPTQAFFWNPLHLVEYLWRMTSVWLPVKSKILYVRKGNVQPKKLDSPTISLRFKYTLRAKRVARHAVFIAKHTRTSAPNSSYVKTALNLPTTGLRHWALINALIGQLSACSKSKNGETMEYQDIRDIFSFLIFTSPYFSQKIIQLPLKILGLIFLESFEQ